MDDEIEDLRTGEIEFCAERACQRVEHWLNRVGNRAVGAIDEVIPGRWAAAENFLQNVCIESVTGAAQFGEDLFDLFQGANLLH